MAKDANKAKALAALLDSSTFTEAAEKAGISRQTLYRFMRDDADFSRAYKEAQERIALEQAETIAEERRRAKETIFSIMEDAAQPAAVRLKAAQSVLEATEAQEIRQRNIITANLQRKSNPFSFVSND